jgi:transposase
MMTPATPREALLEKEIETLRARNHEQEIIIKVLREKIDLLVRKVFGKSSEVLDDKQLMLLLEASEGAKKAEASASAMAALEAEIEAESKVGKQRKSKQEREPRIPDHLPVSEQIVIDPDEVKAAPEAYRHITDEVTEQLDYQPGRYTKRLIIRRKYAKRDNPYQAPIIAELPVLMERCKAGPGLLAHIIVSKYCHHLPLYRQEQIARQQHSIELPRQTTARWLGWVARCLSPIYEHIHRRVITEHYLQCDETCVEYLQPGNGQTKQGWFWVLKAPRGDAVFAWKQSRASTVLTHLLPEGFAGTLGCDGYAAYQSHAMSNEQRIRLAACWAHVRRKYDEAKAAYPHQALTMLKLIGHLYRIERRLRRSKAGPRLRQAVRTSESAPIIARIGRLIGRWQARAIATPQSLLGKAMSYTQSLWPLLQTYVEDGRAEIDNNLVENAIRPTAVGKKNWLFIGEADAGNTSAILFTLIEACRRQQIDPWRYLRDVLTRLPMMKITEVGQLTPEAWKVPRRATAPEKAEESKPALAA